jgi:hypothetical protein
MEKIYDADGNELGSVPLTEKQRDALDAGGSIAVLYHTPQLMHAELGKRSGSFSLHKDGDRLVTTTPAAVKDYAQLRTAIDVLTKAREAS